MHTQIGRFVTDRTTMLAAISHKLRTPLTRMRLRGEFIDDPGQQAHPFRNVPEMQATIDTALSLFHDEAIKKGSTDFDLSELVRLVIDDLADQGGMISFKGIDHVIHHRRPFALKRRSGASPGMQAFMLAAPRGGLISTRLGSRRVTPPVTACSCWSR